VIKKIRIVNCFCLLFIFLASNVCSEVIKLHLPLIVDSSQSRFYHELLITAIQEAGHTPKLIIHKVPHKRAKIMLQHGQASIFQMLASAQRDQEFIPIEVGITNGLIGKRILFIKKGSQPIYDQIKSLEDFQKLDLVGGMGRNWFDVKVWKANDLQYKEQDGNWASIFKMLAAGRSYDYFSRGLCEILTEAKQHPRLDIEKKLVLIYDRDSRFYLSKTGPNAGAKYKDILDSAMKTAKKSGLIDKLVKKHWANDFKTLRYDQRIKIHLKTPS